MGRGRMMNKIKLDYAACYGHSMLLSLLAGVRIHLLSCFEYVFLIDRFSFSSILFAIRHNFPVIVCRDL